MKVQKKQIIWLGGNNGAVSADNTKVYKDGDGSAGNKVRYTSIVVAEETEHQAKIRQFYSSEGRGVVSYNTGIDDNGTT